jgi:hypothetical protein
MAEYKFELIVSPGEDMGMDTAEQVLDVIEEIIHDSGLDNGAGISVRLVSESG